MIKSLDVTGYIYADSAEPKSINELRLRGHKIAPCSKGKDSIVYGIELINQNDIFVTARSLNLLNELQNYTWKTNRDGDILNTPVDAFNHAIDACRYAIMEQLKTPNRGTYHIH